MKPIKLRLFLAILMLMSLFACLSCGSDDLNPTEQSQDHSDPLMTGAIIIDHTSTDLSFVPLEWIEEARVGLHIAYGHTSHGSQITIGMAGLVNFAGAPYGGDTYTWNSGGTNGALDLRDNPFSGASDLGNPNRTAWADATRDYLDSNPDINAII